MKNYLFLAIQLLATLAFSQKYHINEDFNNSALPSGWTNNAVSGTQAWSFGIDGANAHQGNQNIDSTAMAFFDDDAIGQGFFGNKVELITSSFNNTPETFTYLEFDYNLRQYSPISDSFYVDIYDGNQWQRLYSVWQDDCGNYLSTNCINNFPKAILDISNFSNSNCQIRFGYFDGNGSGPFDYGWYVGLDNVKIWSPYANNLATATVLEPKSECGLSATDSIKVLVTNLGHQTQQNFDIAYELNGNPAVVETITDSLAYQDSLIYTFSNTGDFSRVGPHDIKVYTLLSNDSILTNDTLSVQVSNDTAYQLPYFNDFENSNNGWTSSGTNSSWAWGVPAGNVIDSAYSGQNAWVTNLNGNYNNNELSYLTSPCFDFSNQIADPIISFYLNHRIELNFDELWLESSIDNGQNWQKVQTTYMSKNWYNYKKLQIWGNNSNGWIRATNYLGNLGGEPQVKLRFVFDSDPSTVKEGVGIDNISILVKKLMILVLIILKLSVV